MISHMGNDSGLDGWILDVFVDELDVVKTRLQHFGCAKES